MAHYSTHSVCTPRVVTREKNGPTVAHACHKCTGSIQS